MWNCYDFRDLCTGDMVTVRFIQYFDQDDLADSLTKEPLGPQSASELIISVASRHHKGHKALQMEAAYVVEIKDIIAPAIGVPCLSSRSSPLLRMYLLKQLNHENLLTLGQHEGPSCCL